MESFDFNTALSKYIVGQKRTGKGKQFVFINGDYAIKGPYSEKRLSNVITRSQILSKWGSPVAVLLIDQFNTPDGIFIRFPNIMKGYNLETEEHNESFSDYKYNILKNQPVIDIGSILSVKNGKWIYPLMEDTLLTLCHCYILNVGDMNVRNTMIDPNTKQFYVIDYDDNLGSNREDEIFYFNKAPAKKYNWYENCASHYSKIADRLIPLLNDEIVLNNNLIEKVQKTIDLLRKYSKNQIIIPNLTLRVIPKIPMPSSGNMIWKGLMGGSKTYSNIPLDIAKSALQKYIRRNMTDRAILSAIELYRFSEIPEAKAAVTNLYNRLAIIANEDIGPANLDLVLSVTNVVESGDRDVKLLVTMVKLLSESKKTRLPSHCWRTYANPEGRAIAIELGLSIDAQFSDNDIKFFNENQNCDIFFPSDPGNIRCYLIMFWNRLINKDYNCFVWCSYYLDVAKDITLIKRKKFIKGNQRCSTGKADILIWKVLAKFLSTECHDILVEAYYNHSESRPFLQHAIVIALHDLPYQKLDIIIDNSIDVNKLLKGEYKLEIDDFVIDKHTRAGRENGMTVKDFVDDGALVIPEDMTYHNETLAKIYSMR